MATLFYSLLHFLVDFGCAYAMFSRFIPGSGGYEGILIYNFCAFALQMPIGTAMDLLAGKGKRLPQWCVGIGALITLLGMVTHPAILGLGNALFHVGGGIGTIAEDHAHHRRGQALGIFVAPGALGLFLGTLLANTWGASAALPCLAVLTSAMAFCMAALVFSGKEPESVSLPSGGGTVLLPAVCCFAVVILRSYIGMAVGFPWKSDPGLSAVSVVAVVLGKMAGGILAARFGTRRTVLCSLILAALCYLGGETAALGILALFFFNMTMPITLYLLVCRLPRLPGFSFGLLTFGLFLGFLPVYYGWPAPLPGPWLGAAGSVLSLLILLVFLGKEGAHGQISA